MRLLNDTVVTAELRDLNNGSWAVDYFFAEPQKAMFFSRSLGDYRTSTWAPQEGSPAIERIGGFDAMVFDAPTSEVSYVISPYTGDVIGDYSPWLAFSDGSLALYTGQFELLSAVSGDEILSLEGNLGAWEGEQGTLGVRVMTDQSMLLDGSVYAGEVETRTRGEGDYVMIGDTPLEEGESYIGVIDAALPAEIADSLDADLNGIFGGYEDAFGYALPQKVTLYFAFGGFENPGYSFSGSVIGSNLIVMNVSGEVLRDYPPAIREHILWFFAHESAHVFQGVEGAMPGLGGDSWIHEGSANTMATQILMRTGVAGASYQVSEMNRALDECAAGLAEGPLTSLAGQVHYACGDIIFTMAATSLSDDDVYDIWRAFQTAVAENEDEGFDTALVISVFEEMGVKPATLEAIEAVLYEPLSDPRAELVAGLVTSGLTLHFNDAGQVTDFQTP